MTIGTPAKGPVTGAAASAVAASYRGWMIALNLRVDPLRSVDRRLDELGSGGLSTAYQFGLCGGIERGEIVGYSHGLEP